MNITLFKDVGSPKNPELIDLIKYLFKTRDGEWEIDVGLCRRLKTKEERKEYKIKMPTACLSGEFSYRNDQNLVVHNHIIAMDLDEIENLNILKNKLKKDKYVFSVFLSTSGRGLRVLFKIIPQKHNEAFKGICQYIYEKYGESCDTNSSLSKPYIVSFDPDLYLNPDYENVPYFEHYVKEKVIKGIPSYIHNNEDFKEIFQQVVARRIDITGDYNDYLELGFGLSQELGEDGRYYFHKLSEVSELYNYTKCDKQYDACLKHKTDKRPISIRTFYFLAQKNGISVVSNKTKEVIRVTKSSKKAGLNVSQISKNLKEKGGVDGVDDLIQKIFDSNEKDGFEEDSENILGILELFIGNSYNLRFNEISGFFEDNGQQVTPTALNTIFIAAKKILPKLDYQLMIRLLKSDFVPTYNPLFEFFGSDGIPVILPPTPVDNGKKYESPLIDKLSQCIKNGNEAYTRYFLRKWLVSIISSAHKIHSPLLFCLLGAQHTGKTEFFRRLMPRELMHYYAESKLDKEKDDELLMTENLIIMDDELGGKSKADALKLKNITSKQWFSLRRPYGDHNEKILRLAVLCGTSNYKDVKSDPTGNRRIICVEVEDIDKELYNTINKKELFLEMYRLYKEGFDWRVVPSDLKLLNQDEEKFTVVIKERELLLRYFAPFSGLVADEDKCEKMSTTDILVDLEKLTGQKLSVTVIGRELGTLGYVKKSVRFGAQVRSLWNVEKVGRPEPKFDAPISPYTAPKKKGEEPDVLPF